jgi:hypothetical protein
LPPCAEPSAADLRADEPPSIGIEPPRPQGAGGPPGRGGPGGKLYDYAPGVENTGWWVGREAARAPRRFRDRVLFVFGSPRNLGYLRALFASRVPPGALREFALSTLHDAVLSFAEGEGRAYDILNSDPIAQRGTASRAVSLWAEVRRLNRAFYEDRLAFLREQAHILDRRAPRDGISEDEEQYHMRMFISDSLRPPGLEHLNTPGPLYALREDQSTWEPKGGREPPGPRVEGFAGRPRSGVAAQSVGADVYVYGEDDAPWSVGDPNRTPEQALAEYWGDGWTVSETQTGAPETVGQGYGADYAWGASWKENGGTRFMRYESVPFWQFGGREGYDYDIEENLGTAARELDGHVRRWDLDRVRRPRGQEYRRHGPRSGPLV